MHKNSICPMLTLKAFASSYLFFLVSASTLAFAHETLESEALNAKILTNNKRLIEYNNSLQETSLPEDFLDFYQEYKNLFPHPKAAIGLPLVSNNNPSLEVMTWRTSYNFRGIIMIPNYLNKKETALIVIHPWSVNELCGIKIPEPNGIYFDIPQSIPIYKDHIQKKLAPFINEIRPYVRHVAFALPGNEDAVRRQLYFGNAQESQQAMISLFDNLKRFLFRGKALKPTLQLREDLIVTSYFKQFPSVDASEYYNGNSLNYPTLLHSLIPWDRTKDLIFFDGDGYEKSKNTLKQKGIKNILLCGYALNLCVKESTFGYVYLQNDFNVFIVSDCCLSSSRATTFTPLLTFADIIDCSTNHLITQSSWIKIIDQKMN